jgi:O-methyltransferase domain
LTRQIRAGLDQSGLFRSACREILSKRGQRRGKTKQFRSAQNLPSLSRCSALAAISFSMEDSTHRFSLTPLGEALKSGAPGSARATIVTLAGDWAWRGWEHMLYSVETGKSGFEKALGMPMFDWLAQHPEDASLFSETMIGVHGAEPAAVAAAYDFSELRTIIDVGGATGNLLTTILGSYPATRGILFDLPHVVRDAPALIDARGLSERVTIEGGSFFESVPMGGTHHP